MSVKERLTQYLEIKGINKSEFGRTIGVSSAYISYENFTKKRGPEPSCKDMKCVCVNPAQNLMRL